ncbi:hypothetical protein D9M70_470530 [compost metagenome]
MLVGAHDKTADLWAQHMGHDVAHVEAGDNQTGRIAGQRQRCGDQRVEHAGPAIGAHRAEVGVAVVEHVLQPSLVVGIGEKTAQPLCFVAAARLQPVWLQLAVDHGDQFQAGKVAQVAASLLLPEARRGKRAAGLPAFAHALDQRLVFVQGAAGGRLHLGQQQVALAAERLDGLQAEQVPAGAGQQHAEQPGGLA